MCQRERKRHWVVHRAWPCVLRFRAVDHFILGGKHPQVSKHHSDCVKGKICFKEIVSNTRLDLNYSSFHAFGLWVFNYLQISSHIYIYIYIYTYISSFCLLLLSIISVMSQFDWLCNVCGCVMSPTSGIYWVELGFINNYKEPQLWLVLLRYSADVASAFPWVVTYGIRAGLVIPCGFRDTTPQSGP